MLTGKRQLPEEFFYWQEKYSLERTDEGRLDCLGKMLKFIPLGYFEFNAVRSHTTQMMRFTRERIRHRISQAERIEASRCFFKTDVFTVSLVGEANSGKTRLLNELCGTSHASTVAPFETKQVLVGSFKHLDAAIRVAEIPSAINSKHLRVLIESDLIIVLPGDTKRFTDFIESLGVSVPLKVLKEYPSNLWSFLGLIVVINQGTPLVLFEGTLLSDLFIREALVNGKLERKSYVLKEGDVIA